MRRNAYDNNGNTPNYVSMFNAPVDLGVVQQHLQQSQQRYDQSAGNWAQTKAKLLDEEGYDPEVKKKVISNIEQNFNEIYKNYNGDLGAAATDVLGLIAGHRNDSYFDLNRTALEKKKQRDAMVMQYGADALKFKDLPKGLMEVDPTTGESKYVDKSAFDFDIEKRQDWAARGAQIWKDVLQNVSRESMPGVSKDGKHIVSTTRSGVGQFGQLDDKFDEVLNEYKSTAEYKQQMKVKMQMEGKSKDEAEKEIAGFVKDLGTSRVAPMSIGLQTMANPDYNGGGNSNGMLNPDYYDKEMNTAVTGANKIFGGASDIIKAANDPTKADVYDRAYVQVKKATSTPDMITTRNAIREELRKSGLNPDNYINQIGYIGLPSGSVANVGRNPDLREGMPVPANYKKVQEKIEAYNVNLKDKLEAAAKGGDYKDANWIYLDPNKALRTGGPKAETAATKAMENTVAKIKRIGLNGFTWEDGDLVNKDVTKLDEKEREALYNIGDVQFMFDPDNGKLAIKTNTKDGRQNIGVPKGLTESLSLARSFGHPEAVEAAVTQNMEFIEGSPRYYKKEGGVKKAYGLPKGVTISRDADNNWIVNVDGEPRYGATNSYHLAKILATKRLGDNYFIDEPELREN